MGGSADSAEEGELGLLARFTAPMLRRRGQMHPLVDFMTPSEGKFILDVLEVFEACATAHIFWLQQELLRVLKFVKYLIERLTLKLQVAACSRACLAG